jgi:hypothetical protein
MTRASTQGIEQLRAQVHKVSGQHEQQLQRLSFCREELKKLKEDRALPELRHKAEGAKQHAEVLRNEAEAASWRAMGVSE